MALITPGKSGKLIAGMLELALRTWVRGPGALSRMGGNLGYIPPACFTLLFNLRSHLPFSCKCRL